MAGGRSVGWEVHSDWRSALPKHLSLRNQRKPRVVSRCDAAKRRHKCQADLDPGQQNNRAKRAEWSNGIHACLQVSGRWHRSQENYGWCAQSPGCHDKQGRPIGRTGKRPRSLGVSLLELARRKHLASLGLAERLNAAVLKCTPLICGIRRDRFNLARMRMHGPRSTQAASVGSTLLTGRRCRKGMPALRNLKANVTQMVAALSSARNRGAEKSVPQAETLTRRKANGTDHCISAEASDVATHGCPALTERAPAPL
jgi:hypothetical protein